MKFALWIELLAMAITLPLGYAGARLIPYNLWRAYRGLDLSDRKVFFVFFLVGPFFGFFFFEYYEILLETLVGGLSILATILLFISLAAWQQKRNSEK